MPTGYSSWIWLDLGIRGDEADLADNDVVVTGAICPVPGTVKEVWVGTNVLPTAGTLAVARSASTAVNLLSAASVNLATGLTAHVGAKQTLAEAGALRVAAGNLIKATWTLTDITAGDDAIFGCLVGIEPDYS